VKVGDLITLSSSAIHRHSLFRFRPAWRAHFYNKQPLVGIILQISSRESATNTKYYIQWLNDIKGPAGRDGRIYGHGQLYGERDYFWRKDLKFVRKKNE
jgi:hypothetical protein